MDDQNTIRRRIIDRAVDLFNAENHNGVGMFTTAHYGQAMKAEFRTPGPTLVNDICTKHLSGMGDIVERSGSNLWRRKARQGDSAPVPAEIIADEQDFLNSADGLREALRPRSDVRLDVARERQLMEIEDKVEKGILQTFTSGGYMFPVGLDGIAWWTIGTMADALKNNDLIWNGLLENMVGLVLYTMAVEGRVVSQPNMLVDGVRVTVFALAPKPSDLQNPR